MYPEIDLDLSLELPERPTTPIAQPRPSKPRVFRRHHAQRWTLNAPIKSEPALPEVETSPSSCTSGLITVDDAHNPGVKLIVGFQPGYLEEIFNSEGVLEPEPSHDELPDVFTEDEEDDADPEKSPLEEHEYETLKATFGISPEIFPTESISHQHTAYLPCQWGVPGSCPHTTRGYNEDIESHLRLYHLQGVRFTSSSLRYVECFWGGEDVCGDLIQLGKLGKHVAMAHLPHEGYTCGTCGRKFGKWDAGAAHEAARGLWGICPRGN